MFRIAIPVCLLSALLLGFNAPRALAAEPAVSEKDDIIYGRQDEMALTLDVFTPANANGAAIVHLANGAWRRAHDNPAFFAELLKRGYTVFRIFTASTPKYTALEQGPEVVRAIRFIRFHAKDYGVDPNRFGIEGASSGGHLAMLGAMAGDDGNPQAGDPVDKVSSRVQAAAVFFPATDFLNYGAEGAVQDGTLGKLAFHHDAFDFTTFDEKSRSVVKINDPAQRRALLAKLSPITYVDEKSPPTFIIHGDQDDVIPLQQSEKIIAKLKAAGVAAQLATLPGRGHGWADFWQVDGGKLADWFDQYLKR